MSQPTGISGWGSVRRSHTGRLSIVLRLSVLLGLCAALLACRPVDSAGTQQVAARQGSEPVAVPPTGGGETVTQPPVSVPGTITEGGPNDDGPEVATRRDGSELARRAAARPLRPGAINDVTFDDLELDMPVGTLFNRSMLAPRAAQLDGQQIRLRGFIFAGSVCQQTGITNFLFVKNTQCKFGPQGLAYCVIMVDLDEGVTTDFTTYPVTVEGTLTVHPIDSDGFTWSVYHIQGQRVF